MRPDEQQQITAPPIEPPAWYDVDLIFGLGALDLGVLLIIGIGVAAVAWVITEGLKERGRLPTKAHRQWAPIILCEIVAVWLFPLSLYGVNVEHTLPLWAAILIAVILGGVGGFGARGAHRFAEGLMQSLFGWATRALGGTPDSDGGDHGNRG